jgi:hypothetical protein
VFVIGGTSRFGDVKRIESLDVQEKVRWLDVCEILVTRSKPTAAMHKDLIYIAGGAKEGRFELLDP